MSFPALETGLNRARLYLRKKRAERFRTRAMGRPFSGSASERLLLVSQAARIPQSQIFPFHHFAADLQRLYGADVCEADLGAVLAGEPTAAIGATVVAFQTPFDIADTDLMRLMQRLRADHPGARIVCLDWFAPTDLRNAARIDSFVDFYVKKHVFRDRACYGKPTLGDTNLTDHYSKRFSIPEAARQFEIPAGFMDKLIVGPSFSTAPQILPSLMGAPPAMAGREFDLHARFVADGSAWYKGMRTEAEAVMDTCAGITVVRGAGVPQYRFMTELQRSKVCFSPFGYGEVCWRDYEAIAAGAVLLKPDMSHIETDPDIFVPWETYVPLAWDLSDFHDTLRRLLSDDALREGIARKAFETLRSWLRSDAFAQKLAPILKRAG